jgi:hypothetical protein
MNAIAARVEAYGMAVKYGNRRLAEERFVAELVEFADPGGNRREIFWGPYLDNEAFRPGREISGFRTGPFGMGTPPSMSTTSIHLRRSIPMSSASNSLISG